MLDVPETDHIRAAMSCLEQTQIGYWNNGRKTDTCRLREEYDANYDRFVCVRLAAYPTAACDASAGARHPSRVTRINSWRIQCHESLQGA